MTIEDAAKILGIPTQTARIRMRRGLLPIGICTKGSREWSYHVIDGWFERFLNGDAVVIPEGVSDIERR